MTALPRRRVLALLAALPPLLTACGSGSPSTGSSASPAPMDPDTRARTAVTAALRPLLAAYDALTPAHPAAAAAALTQLHALAGRPASASASPSASPSASASDTATPGSPGIVRPSAVAAQEQALARLCTAELLRTSPSTARLLASAAAGATLRAVALGARVHPDTHPLAAGTSTAAGAGLAALQGALGAEHAAVYGYGVLGAQLSGRPRTQAQAYYELHRGIRDALSARITAAGGTPVAAAPGYRLPFSVTDAASAKRLAALLEDRLAAVWANGVRAATGAQRREAAGQLLQAALRAQTWGGAVTAFPGLPERAASTTR